mmetsp:Transcript_25943/g.46898  ORF Transcript_25943/g.46898 Transcript_25943/m.46898 type:complete len:283 (-) Transcript_25943:39-887(-)
MARTYHLFALLGTLFPNGLAEYPCEAEIGSACPDSPRSELHLCLKDSSQHDSPTDISSECADFMALNAACAQEIEQLCEEEFYTENTMPCLAKFQDSEEEISDKCQSVMKWALPAEEDEAVEKVTDELGMSQEDYEEKKEWQAKRKKIREEAVERIKMKEVDAKKEQERRELEQFKEEQPEAYAEMLAQQKEEKRQQDEMKRKERMRQAAIQRKKRTEAGEDEDAPAAAKKAKKAKPMSWSKIATNIAVVGLLAGVGYMVYQGLSAGGGGGARNSGKKKKRG